MGAATVDGTGLLAVQPNSTLRISSQSNTSLHRVTAVFGTIAVGAARGSSLTINGSDERLRIHPEGTRQLVDAARITGSVDASIRNQGTLRVTGDQIAEVTLALQSEGAFDLQGGELRLRGGGGATHSVEVNRGTTLEMAVFQFGPGTTLSGAGRIEFMGGTNDFTQSMLLPEGTLTFVGGSSTIGNTFPDTVQIEQIRGRGIFNANQVLNSVDAEFGVISGTGNLTFTGVSRLNQSRITSTGQVSVASGALLNVLSLGATITSPLENRGTIQEFNGLTVSGLVNQAGGLVVGTRSMVGDVINAGVLSVGSGGAPLDLLTIQGNDTQAATGVLEIQLGGTTAGSEYDRLQVTGAAVLDGELAVSLLNDFVPSQADLFSIATFSSSDGEFSKLDLPHLSPFGFVVTRKDRSLDLSLEVVGVGDGPTFTGRAAPTAATEISASGLPLGNATADANGIWSFTVPESLLEPRYELTVSGEGPARFDLASPLSLSNADAVDRKGLELVDDTIEYFPFGNDLDGFLEPTDVVLAATQSRLAVPLIGAGTSVGEVFRLNDGRFLLDQDTSEDEVPDCEMVFAGRGADFALAGILPFGMRQIQLRDIDTSQGFAAELVVTGSFDEIEIDNHTPFPERVARDRIREELRQCVGEECEEVVTIFFVEVKQADEEARAMAEIPAVRTIADLDRAQRAILFSDGIEEIVAEEPELAQLLLNRDDPENLILANLFEQRENAIDLVLAKAVTHANSVIDPSADDFRFVLGTIDLVRQAQILTLDVDPGQIVAELEPAIRNEIKRYQIDASSLDEIAEAINPAVSLELATDADPATVTVETMQGFMDAFVARVAVGDNERTKLANTAVQFAVDLTAIPSLDVDQAYTPDGVIQRLRDEISLGYEFDPTNLLPQSLPTQDPPEDEARVAIFVGDLPLTGDGRLTTESVTSLINDVPNEVNRVRPTDEFAFSIAIDNGTIKPLDIPTLTFAFAENPIGKGFESAGFISVGSYGADGEFIQATSAEGFDLIGEVDGFDTSLGVVIDGSGEDRGFFPDEDGRGGEIVAQAAVEFSLQTPNNSPGFHLSVADAGATFDMLVRVDDGLSFSFERFDLTNIVVQRFEAAIGGTPPGTGAESLIPSDALLKLTSTDVEVNIADPTKRLLEFGSLSVELPTAPGDLKTLIADVNEFVIDVDGANNLRPVFGEGFGFTFRNLGSRLKNLGIPDVIQVDALGFHAGPTFFDETGQIDLPSDFLLTLSAGLTLPEPLPIISVAINDLTIDYGAIARGASLIDAVDLAGASGRMGPRDLGPLGVFEGSFAMERIEYDAPGGGTDTAFLLRTQGGLDFAGAGLALDAAITLNPLSFVGAGVEFTADVPLGTTGFSIKGGGGRFVSNPPPIRDVRVPLDLFVESDDPGVLDFSDLAEPLTFEQLKVSARRLLENANVADWAAPWLLALDLDVGIQGDASNTFLLETTVGARVDPNEDNAKIFGLGTLTVKPPAQSEIRLGEAGVLLDLQAGDFRSLSLAFRAGGQDDGLNIPAENLLGVQVTKREDLFEIAVQGKVSIDGLSGKDEDGRPRGFEAGGLFVLEPGVGMYGATQFTVGVNQPGDPLFFGGELFLRFNPYDVEHELDPILARALVPKLVNDGRAVIPPGFGLIGEVQLTVGDILDAAGSVEIDSSPGRFTANVNLAGKVLVLNQAYPDCLARHLRMKNSKYPAVCWSFRRSPTSRS